MSTIAETSNPSLNDSPEFQRLSNLAETLIGSEIVRLNGEIRERMKAGDRIFNYTIGDFDPSIFPIPKELEEEIIHCYRQHMTNYPAGEGELELRKAVSRFLAERENLDYDPGEILIACGGRPLIYDVYRTIVDRGDKVIYTVPSWNNNHYAHFVEAQHCALETFPEDDFMPTAERLKPHIEDATLLTLCSPLNPTGTAFSKEQLEKICDLVISENNRRPAGARKLFILFDQIYWLLTYGETKHHNPVSLRPELKPYTIFIDGISKCFAATGVRVGWALGPERVIGKMKAILSHLGAWSPLPEQRATARFLLQKGAIDPYMKQFKSGIEERLNRIFEGFMKLKSEGFPVDAIAPQAAIYLTVKLDLKGKLRSDGSLIEKQGDVTRYLLQEAKLAIVPFHAFGAPSDSPWYRLSVGTVRIQEIPEMILKLKGALQKLK